MDQLKGALGLGGDDANVSDQQGTANAAETAQQQQQQGEGQEGGSWFSNKLNSSLGGGKESEKKEDYLDKAIDAYQQYVQGGGDQSNETWQEQQKDEFLSDSIRQGYKQATGQEFFVKDKEH